MPRAITTRFLALGHLGQLAAASRDVGAGRADDQDGKLNMDNPEGLKALETAKAIFHDCAMKPVSGGDASKQFAAGELGMFFSSTAYVGFVDRSKTGAWEFVTGPYPGIDTAPKALPAGGNAAMLTSGSSDPEVLQAAWDFITFTPRARARRRSR